jgi:hypothetical protein
MHIPDELVEHILLDLAETEFNEVWPQNIRLPHTRIRQCVRRLACVSRAWRSIIHTNGHFWVTDIVLTEHSERESTWEEALRGSAAIHRNSNLDVRIKGTSSMRWSTPGLPLLLKALMEHRSRIWRVMFHLPLRGTIFQDITVWDQLVRLASITLHDLDPESTSPESPEQQKKWNLQDAPRLIDLKIVGDLTFSRIVAPKHLQSFTYTRTSPVMVLDGPLPEVNVGPYISAIRENRNIREIHLPGLHLEQEEHYPSSDLIHLGNLQVLEISLTLIGYFQFWEMFDISRLTHLNIEIRRSTSTHIPVDIEKGWPSLPNLIDFGVQILYPSPKFIQPFLQLTPPPTLERFKLTVISAFHTPIRAQDILGESGLHSTMRHLTLDIEGSSISECRDILELLSLEEVETLTIDDELHGAVFTDSSTESTINLPRLVYLECQNFSREHAEEFLSFLEAPLLRVAHFTVRVPRNGFAFKEVPSYLQPFPRTEGLTDMPAIHSRITHLTIPFVSIDWENSPYEAFPFLKDLKLIFYDRHQYQYTDKFLTALQLLAPTSPRVLPRLSRLMVVIWDWNKVPRDVKNITKIKAALMSIHKSRSRQFNSPTLTSSLEVLYGADHERPTSRVWSSDSPGSDRDQWGWFQGLKELILR